MQQMDIPEHIQISIDFEDGWYSETVRTLRPVIFRDGSGFTCILGPDRKTAVTGQGTTVNDALAQWESEVRKRVAGNDSDDDLALYIIDLLNASPKKIN